MGMIIPAVNWGQPYKVDRSPSVVKDLYVGNLLLFGGGGGRGGGLMVSALVSRSSGPGSSPGRGHCVVFLGEILYSQSASLHPGV